MIKRLTIGILFISILIPGCKKKPGNGRIILKYKFEEGKKFLTSVTSIVKTRDNEKPNKFEFNFTTTYNKVLDNGKKTKLTYRFETLKLNGKIIKPLIRSFNVIMKNTGKINIKLPNLKNFQSTITFTDEAVKPGETWETYLTAPVQQKHFQVPLKAKFVKIANYKSKNAALITYRGIKDKIMINNDEYKVIISGKKYFNTKLGMYLYIHSIYDYFIKTGNKWQLFMKIDVSTKLKDIEQS